MYILALCVIIMYKVADISGMSGLVWGGLTLVVSLALSPIIPIMLFAAPLACVLVYIPLLYFSIKQGPQ